MMPRLSRNRAANEFEAALVGEAEPVPPAAQLRSLASELRIAGLALPEPHLSPLRREELRLAVLDAAAARRNTGAAARFRGATFGVAAVAGAGLVVASAASGSNPASFVVDAARELPRIASHDAPPATVSIEGEVIATHDGGRTLEVRSGDETLLIESPRLARDVTTDGTPVPGSSIEEGTTVRVTSNRDSDAGVVSAKKIEVIPPVLAPAPRVAATAFGNSPPASGATGDGRPSASNVTPKPTATPSPATPTPKANATALAPALPYDPPAGATLTATPPPLPTSTPTPRPKPTTPAPVENDTANISADK